MFENEEKKLENSMLTKIVSDFWKATFVSTTRKKDKAVQNR